MFADCTSLETLTLSPKLNYIPTGTFYNCTSLKDITIPDNVTTIGESAFKGCSSLDNITFPKSYLEIGKSSFEDCVSLTDINIQNLKSAAAYSFSKCTSLKNVKLAGDFSQIKEYSFLKCSNLESIEIPTSVSKVLEYAFMDCEKLKSFDFANIEDVGNLSFYNCKSLEKINFTDNLKNISADAFGHCSSLTTLTLPPSIKTIVRSFTYCTDLYTVNCYKQTPPDYGFTDGKPLYADVFYNSYPEYMTLHVPRGCYDVYANEKLCWGKFGTIIDDLGEWSGIEEVSVNQSIDYAKPFEVYNLQGQKVGDDTSELPRGIYIIRQGNKTEKRIVR